MTRQDPDRAEIAARLADQVGRINRMIRAGAPELSFGQLATLVTIARLGPIRPVDVARAERTTAPSMTRLIGPLEAAGLIERSPDPADGRAFFVSITEAGRASLTAARAERAAHLAELLDGRTDEDFAALARALDILESTRE